MSGELPAPSPAAAEPADIDAHSPHRIAAAVDAALEALDDVARAFDATAARHGVRAVERITGVDRSAVSRWRRGELPGVARLRSVAAELRAAGCG